MIPRQPRFIEGPKHVDIFQFTQRHKTTDKKTINYRIHPKRTIVYFTKFVKKKKLASSYITILCILLPAYAGMIRLINQLHFRLLYLQLFTP